MNTEISNVLIREGDNPEIVYFYDRKLGYNGFYGDDLDNNGKECIGINLGGSNLRESIKHLGSLYGCYFSFEYLFLHELSHWALNEGSEDTHAKGWFEFIVQKLMIPLRSKTFVQKLNDKEKTP